MSEHDCQEGMFDTMRLCRVEIECIINRVVIIAEGSLTKQIEKDSLTRNCMLCKLAS